MIDYTRDPITNTERRVLAVYPEAECWYTTNGYTIFECTPIPPWKGCHWVANELGTGPTAEQAWANAAARLDAPVAPPDGTR